MTPRDRDPAPDELLDWLAAGRGRGWTMPPESVRRRSLSRAGTPAPGRPRRRRKAEWEPADVRGAAAPASGQPRALTGSAPGIVVSLLVTPRPGEHRREIRGKVWLEERASASLFLVHDDHVVGEVTLASSGEFLFDDPLPPGWSLEVHPRRGTALVIADPETGPEAA
ncbi:MAG TPA: hypothetical protein VKU85_15485 [bacterium]|nr:hypothetical protein [bacterium]